MHGTGRYLTFLPNYRINSDRYKRPALLPAGYPCRYIIKHPNMNNRQQPLFSKYDLRAILENHRKKAEETIAKLPASKVSADNEMAVLDKLEQDFKIAPLELFEDKVEVDQTEVQIDVKANIFNMGFTRVSGLRLQYFVPYSGDRELWWCLPSQYNMNPPIAEVGDREIIFEFEVPATDIAKTKEWFDISLRAAKQWIGFIREDVNVFNSQIRSVLQTALQRRRDILTKTASQLETLGLPARKKNELSQERPFVPSPRKTTPSRRKRPSSEALKDYDIALSFAGEDRDYVEHVATLLREAGINVFYDKFETANLWGRNLADHLGEIYGKRSRFVVMFISKYYPTKSWPTHERQNAQARAIQENKVVLLPARFDDTEIPGLPSTTGYIDLRQTTPQELVKLIKEKLKEHS